MKKALAKASAFFNEARLGRMKNEAAFGYEECGNERKTACVLRFIFHGGKAAASYLRSKLHNSWSVILWMFF